MIQIEKFARNLAANAGEFLDHHTRYHATEEQGTAVDFNALKKDVENTLEFCKSNPGIGVYTASEKFMGENATEQSGEAIDLATIKCEKVIDAANKNEDGLTIIMMWLAGYYANYAQDKIIDFKKLETESFSIGKKCAENRQNGLVTVADTYMQHQSFYGMAEMMVSAIARATA